MRTTVRSALVAGGVAVLGFGVTPAVAAINDGPGVDRPSPVAAEARGDDGAKLKVCDDELMTDGTRQGAPEMAAMHRAHVRGVGVGPAGMGSMHRAHHGEDTDAGEDMMGGAVDMMDDTAGMMDDTAGMMGDVEHM